VSYKLWATAEQLGIVGIIDGPLGQYLVLDKGEEDYDTVLIIPFPWEHRQVKRRDEL
jgi:hypothetical protein